MAGPGLRRRWYLRSALATALVAVAVAIYRHSEPSVHLSSVVHAMAAVDAAHLGLLLLIWAAAMTVHCAIVSLALPGLGMRRTVTVTLAGSALAGTIPMGGALAAAVNWRLTRRWGRSNAAFVAYTTVTHGLAVLMKLLIPLVALGGLLSQSARVPALLWWACGGCAAALVLLAGAVMWAATHRRATASLRPRWAWAGFFAGSGDQILNVVRRSWAPLLGGGLACSVAQIALLGVSLGAVGLAVPVTALVAAAAIQRLGTLVSLTPGGAGVAELGTVAWLIATGLDPTGAVAGVVLYRMFMLATELAMGATLLVGWAFAGRRSALPTLSRPALVSPT